VPNKKKPTEPDYEFYSMKLELQVDSGGRKFTAIPEFSLDRGVSFEEFAIGDHVEVDFYLTGKKISDTWYKSEAKITYMKFADITSPPPPKTSNGKVRVNSMTDTKELTNPKLPPKPDVFDTPRTSQMVQEEDEFKDLPF